MPLLHHGPAQTESNYLYRIMPKKASVFELPTVAPAGSRCRNARRRQVAPLWYAVRTLHHP